MRSLASRAASTDHRITDRYNTSAASTPRNPFSSASTEKMKSLWATGRNLYWPCVPFMNPLPVRPPDPTVIRASLPIPVALRVQLRIDERRDARLLIVLEGELPRDRRHQHGGKSEDGDELEPQPGEIGDAETDRNQRDGGAEIGLPGDEEERHGGEGPGRQRSPGLRAPRRFSPKNIASISATVTRPNSDGCRLNGPT